jgi:hypothetical protein
VNTEFAGINMKGDLMDSLLSEDVLVPIALFAMVVLLVWFGHKVKRARIQEQGELRKRLLDKFGSGHELTEFLATPQGQSFLKDQEASAAQRSPKGRIINSVGTGWLMWKVSITAKLPPLWGSRKKAFACCCFGHAKIWRASWDGRMAFMERHHESDFMSARSKRLQCSPDGLLG